MEEWIILGGRENSTLRRKKGELGDKKRG